MQTTQGEPAVEMWLGPGVRVELPWSLHEDAGTVLGPLRAASPFEVPLVPDAAPGNRDPVTWRAVDGADGWWLEHGGRREGVACKDELLLRLQELWVERLARRENRLLFRGSVVTRGSQSVLIVGDPGEAEVLLAAALASLGFLPTSIGFAAFEAQRLMPLPLPLAFRLQLRAWAELQALPGNASDPLGRLSPVLFRAQRTAPAPEPTHIIFPVERDDLTPLARPISAAAARARLCRALTVAPDDPPPFAAVARLVHHARGVLLGTANIPQAVEHLARLLPQWNPPR